MAGGCGKMSCRSDVSAIYTTATDLTDASAGITEVEMPFNRF